ncbi:MAG: VWA domain-containing protein [Clostridiales bacterium]|jgi:LPXTG-motif cell wall-anchored protein|nr:VWA domain-containing protein [Clostridiales bacterium]
MKKRLFFKIGRSLTAALTVLMIGTLLIAYVPLITSSFAAFSDGLSVKEKTVIQDEESGHEPDGLKDGQVYAWKDVDMGDPDDGKFKVTLAAIGQEFYNQPISVIFVLDASNSMSVDDRIVKVKDALNKISSDIFKSNINNELALIAFNNGNVILRELSNYALDLEVITHDGKLALISKNENKKIGIHIEKGTNIQGSINSAYRMISSVTLYRPYYKPVIILLTDGVPCIYHEDYKSYPLADGYDYVENAGFIVDGDGDPTKIDGIYKRKGMNAAAYTIMQAVQVQRAIPDLDIYTIGAIKNSLTEAVLNPTPENIKACTGAGTPLYKLLGYNDSTEIDDFYYYPRDYIYNQSFSNLYNILNDRIMQNYFNDYKYTLHPNKNIVFTDKIGYGFKIPESLTMTMSSGTYNLIYDNDTKQYIPQSGTIIPDGISVTISEDRVLTWEFPASELPLNYYDANGNLNEVPPAKLTFVLELDPEIAQTDVDYYTNYDDEPGDSTPGAVARFYPDTSNDFYSFYAESYRTNSVLPSAHEIEMDETGKIMLVSSPEDPKEPEDPEDPEDPENPEDPEDPEQPEDPEDPEETEEPTTPSNPVIPLNPSPSSPSPTPSPTITPEPSPAPEQTFEPEPYPETGILGDVDKPDDETGVAGEYEKLPQTGGISVSTILGLIGIALMAVGAVFYSFRKRHSTGKQE